MINNKRRSEEETVSSSSCGLPHQNVLWHDDDDDRDNEEEEESSAEGCDSDSNVLLAGNLRTIARKNLDELSSEVSVFACIIETKATDYVIFRNAVPNFASDTDCQQKSGPIPNGRGLQNGGEVILSTSFRAYF
jgi:hypothetical protein